MMRPATLDPYLNGLRLGLAVLVALLGAWLSVVHRLPGPADPQGLEAPPTFMPALLILDSDSAAPAPPPVPAAAQPGHDLT